MSTIPRLTRESMDQGIHIDPLCYCLELEPSVPGGRPNYYIGISLCGLHARLAQHFAGPGSKWTRQHKPTRIHSVRWGGTQVERRLTLVMAKVFGAAHVRGGPWCQSPPPIHAMGPCDSDIGTSDSDTSASTGDDPAKGRADRATSWRRRSPSIEL